MSRYKSINTASPYECTLLLAITLDNESAAERLLHEHFKAHRTNGEWFEINFATAFRALLDLKLIPDHPQMILELPTIPPRDPWFEPWIASRWPELTLPEDEQAKAHELDALWQTEHHAFVVAKERYGELDAMLAANKPRSIEDRRSFIAGLRKMLEEQTTDPSS